MRKLIAFVVSMATVAALAACGGGAGSPGSTASNESSKDTLKVLEYTPIKTVGKTMAATTVTQTGKALYKLAFPKKLVAGSRAKPFYRSSTSAWQAVDMIGETADGAYFIGSFTVYDEIVELNYGGDYNSTPASYADMSLISGGFYDAVKGTLFVGFHQGSIYNKTDFPTPIAVPPPLVKMTSSELLASGMYRYNLEFNFEGLTDLTAPFVMGEFNNWGKAPVVIASNGLATYVVETYNKQIRFTFGGNANSAQGFASLEGSEYYVAADNALVADFFNGAMLKKGLSVPVAYGGTATDTGNVIGFTLSADGLSLTTYVNVAGKVSGALTNAFIEINGVRSALTLDANGWGSVTTPITKPAILWINFGAGLVGTEVYANISGSQFYVASLGSHQQVIGVELTMAGTLVLPTAISIGTAP